MMGDETSSALWVGISGKGAKYWLQVLAEPREPWRRRCQHRGVRQLNWLPESITATWPASLIRTCGLHLIRGTFRLARHPGLGRSRKRSAADLHPSHRTSSEGTLRRVHRDLGPQVSGDRADVGVRVGRVRAVPAVRPGNPQDRLFRLTPSSRSTPGPVGLFGPVVISRTNKPLPNASTSPCVPSTRPAKAEPYG